MARLCRWLFFISLGVVGALIGQFGYKLSIHVKPEETPGYTCKHLEKNGVHTRGPEDILYYNSTYLIATSNDNFKLWEIGTFDDAPNGSILLVKNYQTTSEIINLKVVGFPANVRFHPHGAYIRKEDDLLFVVNHSYSSGNGDRIEVFKLDIGQQTLTYKNTIQLPSQFIGVANNLIVTAKGNIYLTKYIATEDPLTGRQAKPFLLKLEYIIHVLFSIHKTHVYKCTYEENWASKTPIATTCTVQDQTSSIMANGITWDGKETLYLADTTSKTVRRYKITDKQLEQTGIVELPFSPDNLELDPSTGRLNTAGPTKAIDHISYIEQGKKAGSQPLTAEEFWCGVGFVDVKTFTFNEVAKIKNSVIGCSSAYTSNKKIIIGSWTDKALVECVKK